MRAEQEMGDHETFLLKQIPVYSLPHKDYLLLHWNLADLRIGLSIEMTAYC